MATSIVVLMSLVSSGLALTVDYFPANCNGKASIETSHQLESSRGLNYQNNMSCTYTVTAPSNRRVLAKFQRFDFERKLNGSCVDYVNVYDGENTAAARLNEEPLCGIMLPTYFNSTKSSISISMVTDKDGVYRGFGLTFTVVYDEPCSKGYYECNNSLCIAGELACNGLDQCGDDSDEAHCSTQDLLFNYVDDHGPMIAGIVLGVLVAGIAAAVIGMYVYKRNKWQQFLNDTDAEDDSIWEIESAYPVTQRYFKGARSRTNYNTLSEPGEAQPAISESDGLPRDIDLTAEPSTSNTNV